MRRETALDGAAALGRQGFLDAAQGLLGAARAGVAPARFAEAQLRIRLAQARMRSREVLCMVVCVLSSYTGAETGVCSRQTVQAHAHFPDALYCLSMKHT